LDRTDARSVPKAAAALPEAAGEAEAAAAGAGAVRHVVVAAVASVPVAWRRV